MTLLEKMDRAVYATGIDKIIFRKFRPRTLRWTPLFVLAALIAGYVIMAQAGRVAATLLTGAGIFYGAFMLAMLLRIFGPRMVPSTSQPLDERELTVKARASAMSGTVMAFIAMMGCFYMSAAGVLDLWRPRDPNQWLALGFGLQACFTLLPTWIASWIQPRPIPDDED